MANNSKKYASLTSLQNLVKNIKNIFATKTDVSTELAKKANTTHNHSIADVANLQSTLDGKVTQTSLDDHTSNSDIHFTAAERTKLLGIAAGAQVNTITGVKGNSESSYRTGNVNITKANIGLGNVDNTADANKTVKHASTADSAASATKATQDGDGKVISSTYETKTDASSKLTEAKTYADNAANKVKNDLLNGAGGAYDTLKELGDLIDDNKDAIDVLEDVAAGKADKTHSHTVANITDLTATATELNYMDGVTSNVQSQLDSKANGTHNHSASEITSGTLSSDRLPTVPISKGGTGGTTAAAARTNLQITPENIGAVKKTGDTMSGSLTVQMDTDTAPQFTLKGEANSSGQRTSTIIRKYAFANSDYGTEIEDKTFNGSYIRLGLNTTATTPAERIVLKNRMYDANGAYSDKTYKLYGEHNKPTLSDIGLAVTATELNYLDGVTSNVQAQLDSKLEAITGAASTIVSDDLTTNRVLISDNYGKVSASNISGGELSRLSGATKNIQEQIDDLDEAVDNKVSKYGDTMTGSLAIEPTSTTSPLISLIGNANASGQQAKSRFRKGTNSSVDNGTEVVDETFDGRKTSLILQSNKDLDKNRLRLKLTASDGTYEEYNLYGEHYKPTAADLGALENSSYDLHSFVTDRSVMYASNIVSDDVIPFVDVSLRSGRKITMTEFLKYISNNAGLASVASMSTAEYTALENAGTLNANTLYMLTDAEEETPTQVQIITWESDD